MIDIVFVWILTSYLLAPALVFEQMRRPLPEWEAAGRNRRFWVTLSLVMSLHALGPFVAAAYLIGVVPRLRTLPGAGPRRPLERTAASIAKRWHSAVGEEPVARPHAQAEELARVAAVLVFVASLIHSIVIADHFDYFWLFGVFFAVVTILQALWTAAVWTTPLDPRLLLMGAIGNAALVVVWAISRFIGVPIGPKPGETEPVGVADAWATVDEIGAVILVAIVLARLRAGRRTISPISLRFAVALSGPAFIASVMAAFGAEHAH